MIAIILIVLVTIIFIGLGFAVTDSLIDISQQPYNDKNTYTAASEESSADGANQQVSSSVSASAYQSQQAGNY